MVRINPEAIHLAANCGGVGCGLLLIASVCVAPIVGFEVVAGAARSATEWLPPEGLFQVARNLCICGFGVTGAIAVFAAAANFVFPKN